MATVEDMMLVKWALDTSVPELLDECERHTRNEPRMMGGAYLLIALDQAVYQILDESDRADEEGEEVLVTLAERIRLKQREIREHGYRCSA